ncbi:MULTISPECIES: hypothetical protein [Streptomyces]|uniref:Uncharacterized protein n=1 Tax=Streptomyces thermoviolaceus subsp. thermoviolaceus TaxID=66860 RepID=A0ABX0YQV8_STRTL|nr:MULTISPECIES: hypothetical protein [Streptomyces]MCM3263537.1 hypothetical protein [Streptomyces thermoviolaceus]NJP14965.1 hypothetical protein [Streptomyces thermoviolaceus subsp. thermoviolaceus]RSS07193.1 hypothetical protein EF917_05950 [Streptomyces sp. WAC00469]WTD48033.1 hypothetical protein OG899_11130 [Streptomyces thermoviolaceus]GGV78026.1 hypothetical protein GCM10010499_38000 [Streptomyces thermoviolaceus subsp. apingens]
MRHPHPASQGPLERTEPPGQYGLPPPPGVPPQQRHRALTAVAGIAATVGAVGRPVAEAVDRVLSLIPS